MNTRKTLLAALASGALLLPVVLAAPASATPGGCSDENAGAAGQTHPRCGSDLLRGGVRINADVNVGGTCGADTLLLIQVRANEGTTHKTLIDARNADRDARTKLRDAQTADLAAEKAVSDAQGVVAADTATRNADETADQASDSVMDTKPETDAEDTRVDADNAQIQADQNKLPGLTTAEDQRDADLESAQHRVDYVTHPALVKAESADRVLVVRIGALVDRINHECGTPTPVPPPTTTPVPPPTTDVPPPPAATAPPSGSNNTQVIVQGPAPQVVQGPSQIGQAPQGFVSAGGGADAAIVSAQS